LYSIARGDQVLVSLRLAAVFGAGYDGVLTYDISCRISDGVGSFQPCLSASVAE